MSELLEAVRARLRRSHEITSRVDAQLERAQPGAGAAPAQPGTSAALALAPEMIALYAQVDQVAASPLSVLVLGETGVGKEVVARELHRRSPRAAGPFLPLNCAALSEQLLEAELFGYERGAFTGAVKKREGRFKSADGGTVFVDEIAELPLSAQAKLLRVLQEGTFEPIGTNTTVKVDVRVISATHRNLKDRISDGSFREDLFYRVNVVAIAMPALRDRREDIPLLATHFLQKHARTSARRIALIAPETMACLTAYDWPGNVRELENVIERAIVLGTTEQILPDDLPDSIVESRV